MSLYRVMRDPLENKLIVQGGAYVARLERRSNGAPRAANRHGRSTILSTGVRLVLGAD
jgi:hypothetical protein